ncbi:hypothetical protein ES703_74409 [subsurface metagenome]
MQSIYQFLPSLRTTETPFRDIHYAVDKYSRGHHVLGIDLTHLYYFIHFSDCDFGCHRHYRLVHPVSSQVVQIAHLVRLVSHDERVVGQYRLFVDVLLAIDNPLLLTFLQNGSHAYRAINRTKASGTGKEP